MTKAPRAVASAPGDGEMAPEGTEGAEYPTYPDKIRLTHQHSFIDEDGNHRVWKGGHVTTDEDEITLLVDRKASYEVLE